MVRKDGVGRKSWLECKFRKIAKSLLEKLLYLIFIPLPLAARAF